jgi:hypothetical protein
MVEENEGLGASAADAADRVGGLRPEPTASSQPSGRSPTGAGAWPAGPYTFDEISAHRPDDGLGYIYLTEHPSGLGPTLAHTGDMVLTSVENRALGHLFAAAPDLAEAVERLLASHKPGAGQCCAAADFAIAALSKALGKAA